jgi:hypothetical protein
LDQQRKGGRWLEACGKGLLFDRREDPIAGTACTGSHDVSKALCGTQIGWNFARGEHDSFCRPTAFRRGEEEHLLEEVISSWRGGGVDETPDREMLYRGELRWETAGYRNGVWKKPVARHPHGNLAAWDDASIRALEGGRSPVAGVEGMEGDGVMPSGLVSRVA